MSWYSKLLHSDEDTQKCLLEIDTRHAENVMIESHVIYENDIDREYVAEETEEDTNKRSKGSSRKKNHVRLYKTVV